MHLSNRRSLLLVIALSWVAPLFFASGQHSLAAQATRTRISGPVTPTPTPTPMAVPAASPTPAQVNGQTIESLQAAIRQRLFSPALRRGRVGIKVISLASGKVIFEQDSEKYFMPASNQKNFTVAAALERLTPDFRMVTSVYAAGLPDEQGVIRGDLRIYGRGDISVSGTFNNGDAMKGIDNLADKIIAAGVKRIEGSIIGDESYFSGPAFPGSWEYDDLQWYYGAEISALQVNDGAFSLAVRPGPAGYACSVTLDPANQLVEVVNLCTSTGTRRTLGVHKRADRNIIEITGNVPVGDVGFRGSITFSRPADLFVALLKQRLEAKGVTVTGGTRLQPAKVASDPAQIEIAKLESPPLSQIAARTMKPSQNMYTETLLWTLGEQIGRKNGQTGNSSDLGIAVMKDFMKQIGVPDDGILPTDGSGLSRHNLVTPAAVTSLYSYMAKQSRYSQAWRDSLTIGGVDGTLTNRFRGTAAAANVRGKTGTINQVSALSGYVTTAGGEELVFSIIVNGVPQTGDRTSLIDAIVVNLADFNGKID